MRLKSLEVSEIHGFAVPRLLDYDDSLRAIEMEIVAPPYVLDFAGARLDSPPNFPVDVMEEWEREKEEQFEGNWPVVRSVMAEFESMGIYLGDIHGGNIRFSQPE